MPKPSAPNAPELGEQLVAANRLAHDLSADLNAVRADNIRLTAERDASVQRASAAETRAADAEAARKAAVASVPEIANRRASEILASVGHAPVASHGDAGSRLPSGVTSGDPDAIRKQFAGMKPGTPEANSFWKQHRAVLIGR